MKILLQLFPASINEKIALTTCKMGATLDWALGFKLSASSFNFKTRASAGGSTSPIEGQQFYLWVERDKCSPSVLKALQKKFKERAYSELPIDPETYEFLSFTEPMTKQEFTKAGLKLTASVGLAS